MTWAFFPDMKFKKTSRYRKNTKIKIVCEPAGSSVADRPHCRKSVGHLLAVIGLGCTAGRAYPGSGDGGEISPGLDRFSRHDLACVLVHLGRVAQDRGERLGLSDCGVIDMSAHRARVFVHRGNLLVISSKINFSCRACRRPARPSGWGGALPCLRYTR